MVPELGHRVLVFICLMAETIFIYNLCLTISKHSLTFKKHHSVSGTHILLHITLLEVEICNLVVGGLSRGCGFRQPELHP